ncbi:uncharacterized protein LOC116602290 [Nematostella vectensis]|uniref:uncharacterized protein LOC116602290 n=1 Tax=Nematostella vectensis TaxID=45351 RepID=UPI0020771BC9|nr:uncharacterized protein LOC116602290 [Nematostella vectensis]
MARFKTSSSSSSYKSSSSSKSFTSSGSEAAGSLSMSFKKSESSGGNTLKSTRININQEHVPNFAFVRPQILPVLKPKSWERSTKDMIKKVEPTKPTDVLFFSVKTLPGTALGYTLAIVGEDGSMQYILKSYLEAWNITEKVIMDVALRNLERRLEMNGVDPWKQSRVGVYYIDNLGSVSASVVLIPRYIDGLDVGDGDYVVVVPAGDVCMVAGAKDETKLCIMGEVALKYSKDPQRFNIKPLRFHKNRFSEYVPKIYAKEQIVPKSMDEVAKIRLRLKPIKKEK